MESDKNKTIADLENRISQYKEYSMMLLKIKLN